MPSPAPHGAARDALERFERRLDRVFGPAANPLRHLGALAYGCFWLIAASGLYVYILFDTRSAGAWESVRALEADVLGSVARGLHRYASDAFLVVCVLHLVREWILGRFRGARWFTWVSGVPLLWLAWLAGVVGFWLVWDELGAFSAVATLEWFDALGIFAESLPRNFLSASRVDDRLFSLFVFTHIGLSLFLLLGMWLHVQRLTRPETLPARALGAGLCVMLVLLSLVQPAPLGATADLHAVPRSLPIDWFYLAPHVIQYALSPVWLWSGALAGTVLLCALPWLPPRPVRVPVARVDADNCNGCGRCFVDCPYAAITMRPTPERKGLGALAVVNEDLCVSCGICAGACPSSTPFRGTAALVSGIDMPQLGIGALREATRTALAALEDGARVLIIGCDHGADVRALADRRTASLSLLCTGQLPPAFVEYALRAGARGVVVATCAEGGCEFRQGERWTTERLTGRRDPYLRGSVDARRWTCVQAARAEPHRVRAAVDRLRQGLKAEVTDA